VQRYKKTEVVEKDYSSYNTPECKRCYFLLKLNLLRLSSIDAHLGFSVVPGSHGAEYQAIVEKVRARGNSPPHTANAPGIETYKYVPPTDAHPPELKK
jgi:hypothetical protein